MPKYVFVLAVFALTIPFSSLALDQDDVCRAEAYRACSARAQADYFANAQTYIDNCQKRRLEDGGQNLDCSPQGNIDRVYMEACEREAEKAVCSTAKPKSSADESLVLGLPQEQSGRTPQVNPAPVRAPAAAQRASQPTNGNSSSTPSSPTVASPAPQDSGSAQSEASADIAQCNQLQSEATRCCGNPLACASPAQVQRANNIQQQVKNGPAPGQSIPNYCAQLGQLSSESGDYNADMASVCYGPQSSCSRTCQSLAQKYYTRSSDCTGSICSIFQSAADQLSSLAGNCDSLSAQVNRWSSQGLSTGDSRAGSSLCSNQNYNAQSAGQGQNQKSNPLNHQTQNANGVGASEACLANPNSQECRTATAKAEAQAGGGGTPAGYASLGQDSSSAEFNPENMRDLSALNEKMNLGTDAGGSAVTPASVVANNSGGGIPGSGGGGAGGAKMDPKRPLAPAGSGGSVADIMQGNRSGGGYSQQAGKNSNDNQFGTGGYRASSGAKRGPASVGGADGKGYLGMDLKKYLPGGEMQPYRGIAGLNASMEINGKSADLFKKISTKIEEKCRLGILWECR